MKDDMIIKPNKDNDRKFMNNMMGGKPKKPGDKDDEKSMMESGSNEGPVEYFTE